jgi:hypothetical protein
MLQGRLRRVGLLAGFAILLSGRALGAPRDEKPTLQSAVSASQNDSESKERQARLRGLEQRLDRLVREMEELRSDMRRELGGSSAAKPASVGGQVVLTSPDRVLRIPFEIEPAVSSSLETVQLWFSTDEGRTWREADSATPDMMTFTFRAPHDGIYWLIVRTLDNKGNKNPACLIGVKPMLKVRVQAPPDVRPPERRPKVVQAAPGKRIGQVFIIGNPTTPATVILDAIRLSPGQALDYAGIQAAERNLADLKIFKASQVTILDAETDSPFKDVLVTVQEKPTGVLGLELQIAR